MKRQLRLIIAIVLILIVLAAFAHYVSGHRNLLTQLAHTPPLTIILLLLLYVVWFGAIGLILLATLRICRITMDLKENLLLNAYSTLVNFFVPGQGGIAVRGLYLKATRKLAIRDYVFASLIYYMFYALISGLLVIAFSRPFWEAVVVTLLIGLFSYLVIFLYKRRNKLKPHELELTLPSLGFLLAATLVQSLIQIIIFSVELHSVHSRASLHQTAVYTGVANFALFVALTPGAIGIRESFLIFTRHLSNISSANIIAANVIDRGVFIVFLGILFLITIGFHAKFRSIFNQPGHENDDKSGSSANQQS